MAFNPEELPPLLQSSLLGLLAERQQPIGTSRRRRLKRGLLTGPGPGATPNIPNRRPIAGARDAMGAPVLQRGAGPYPEDKTWWWQQDEPMEFSVPRLPDTTGDPGIMMGMQGNPPGAVVRPMNEEAYLPPMEGGKPLPFDPSFDPSLANGMRDMPSPSGGQGIDPAAMMAGENAARQQAQQFQSPTPMLGMQGTPTPYSVPGVPRETAPAAMPAQPTSDDTWMAFLAAGLSILANNTGHYGQAGPAIGKGGMAGLQMFQQVRQNKRNEAYRQQQMQVQQQQLARQNAQMGIYQQQVEGQLEGQRRKNAQEAAQEALIREIESTPPGPKRDELERLLIFRQGHGAQLLKSKGPGASDKPVEEFVNDENGNPVVKDGQQLVRRWTKHPVTGEWSDSYGFKSGLKVSTTVNMPGETAFSKSLGTKQGDLASEVNAQADLAANTKFSTDLMLDYARKWKAAGGQIGKMADIQGFTAGLLQAANINPEILGLPKDAGPQEAIQAMSNRLTLSKIGGEGGMPANNFSDADRAFLQETTARATNTPTGFVLRLMIERGASRRSMLKDEMLQDELDAAGDGKEQAAYRSFRSKWRKYVAANSAFTPEERVEIDTLVKELSNQGGATQKPSGPVLPPGGYKGPR